METPLSWINRRPGEIVTATTSLSVVEVSAITNTGSGDATKRTVRMVGPEFYYAVPSGHTPCQVQTEASIGSR